MEIVGVQISFDTKYRPVRFDDVMGQESTVRILRGFIRKGAGLRQSYLFAGAYGSGKTTLGRILARALLCENPTPEGDPCDQCHSCKSMLKTGASVDFVEVDAATNSGKAEIQKIIEELQYATMSGKRRIYLFDESHQLSRDALDALLKPLEENAPGSDDKLLVCIFCTTEPEKMRETVLSRCAPPFIIQPVTPADIAVRLAHICEQEGIEYDQDTLRLIADVSECHIRDCLKAVEGVSMTGPVKQENVAEYLHLDAHTAYLDVLEALGTDLGAAHEAVTRVLEQGSPATAYMKLAEVAMLAYQVRIGATKKTSFWDPARIQGLGDKHGDGLLGLIERFTTRPARPTASMLLCDVSVLHLGGVPVVQQRAPVQVEPVRPQAQPPASAPTKPPTNELPPISSVVETSSVETSRVKVSSEVGILLGQSIGAPRNLGEGIVRDDRAVGLAHPAYRETSPSDEVPGHLDHGLFCQLLALRLSELTKGGVESGSARRIDMDSHRTDSPG